VSRDGADRPATQRLFVAVDVPAEVRRRLRPVQDALLAAAPELRPTRPEGWHLTLAFLGQVAEARVGEVVEVLGEVLGVAGREGGGTVGCSLGSPGRFGSGVVWVGVDDDPPGRLATLGGGIQDSLDARGLPVTRQPVRPHVTLARGGRGRPVRAGHLAVVADALARGSDDGDTVSWEVREVQLWRSHLGRGPARYEIVARAPLTT
jgi:RNA 2',3'-cyclic 3'-phosphodiesterase